MTVSIRHGVAQDIPAIAAIHVSSWRETYRGILPDQMLKSLDQGSREAAWRHAMKDGEGFRDVLVAEERGKIVGFGSCGFAWDGDLGVEGEIEAIYVSKRHQLKGTGTCLMGAMATWMQSRDVASAGLWIARDNLAAISFCRTLGGVVAGSRPRPIGGAVVPCVGIVWPDLEELSSWTTAETVTRHRRRRPGEGDALWPRAAA